MTSTSVEIKELATSEEIAGAFPVMKELRPHLTPQTYEELLTAMQPEGYRLFAALEGDQIVALAGVAFHTNLYYGSYLWVYELITTEASRSRGHGVALMDHLEAMARDRGCDTIALSSGLKRVDAHRFYEDKVGFEKNSYAFTKPLKGKPFMPAPDPSA